MDVWWIGSMFMFQCEKKLLCNCLGIKDLYEKQKDMGKSIILEFASSMDCLILTISWWKSLKKSGILGILLDLLTLWISLRASFLVV